MTSPPTIAIDARSLLAPAGGVGRYVRNLVAHLAALPDMPPTLLYTNRPAALSELGLPETGPMQVRHVPARFGWLRLALPLAIRRDGVRLVHFPSTVLPPWVPAQTVVTVYDLAFEFFPETYEPADLAMQKKAVRQASRAGRVITDSKNTASDLIRLYAVPEERVRAIPLAAESRFFEPPPAKAHIPFGLSPGYVLYVGALQPRKNLSRLVEAYAMAHKQGLRAPLVLAGAGDPAYTDQLRALADSLRVRDAVLFPGFVAEADLPALYRRAMVLVYVSLYEGFGLPPLEAMACGTPVIASDTSCFPEVLGDAALLVNPQDPGSISRTLVRLGLDTGLRQTYAERGRACAATYSWAQTARQTLDVYRELL